MKPLRAIVATSAFTVSGAACAAVLGIEHPPPREPHDGAAEAAADARASACEGRPEAGCLCGPHHDFCADFDDVTAAAEGWASDASLPPTLSLFGGGSTRLTDAGAPPSPPNAIVTETTATNGVSIDMLLHALYPPTPFLGVRYRFAVRVESETFTSPAGPLVDAGSACVAALFQGVRFGPTQQGILLVTADTGTYVVASTDVFGKAPATSKQVAVAIPNDWTAVDMLVADRDRAAEEFPECIGEAPGLVVAVKAGLLGEACLALPGGLATGEDWGQGLAVVSGGGTFGAGTLKVLHDDVIVDLLPGK